MKPVNEMTKAELHKEVRYWAREMRRMHVGETFDSAVNADYFAIKENCYPFIGELRSRGLSATDRRIIDAYADAEFRKSKAIDKTMDALYA